MTKSGYGKKLLAVSAGVVMLGSIAATGFVGTDLFKASAEGEVPKMTLEEVDYLSTDGYKIEAKSGSLDVGGTAHAYDYVFTYVFGMDVIKRGGVEDETQCNVFYNGNTTEMVFNLITSTNHNVTADYKLSNSGSAWTIESTNPDVGTLDTQKRHKPSVYVDLGTVKEQAVVTATVDKTNDDDVHVYGTISILFNPIEIEDNEFVYTGATKDKNNLEHVMWLNYGEHDVLGVSTADETWTQAEQFMSVSGFFFKDVYYLENYDLAAATAAPTDAELEGRDLYTLMTGANNVEDGLLMQTEVRADHIEFKKFARGGADATAEMSSPVNFAAGDAIYLKQGLNLLGHDGNGNWAAASEGGAKNVLSRNQIFVFDGENWSSDQFAVTLNIDTNKAMIEEEATTTITPSFDEGKFAPAEKTVTWASDNEAVATVSQEGVITGVAKGTATITASLANGSYKTVAVTVVGATDIDDIKVARRNETLYTAGDKTTAQIEVTITGGSKAPQNVTYATSDATIATVSDSGLITAVGEGTAKITVTAADGEHKAEVTVKVIKSAEENPGDNTGDNDDDNNNGGNTGDNTDDNKPSGCGSVVYGGIAGLGAVVLVAGVALTLRKKHE